ncbi:hypothetical protein [Flavobacterium lipolyticum]|uniref:Uncharacterized protein n=1 Tax=Flavobacterium lipolyticum TaxID=2893754 RepID=A0ABS8LWL2_9FLAO|nr:hypothetical protein [Flavobacterium sp. F-126]MCC9016940.1 hypothetical protein [Flavobacterium sp. F-126]
MNSKVKNEVEAHLLKASGLGEKSVGYKAIKQLFLNEESSLMFNHVLLLDIRRGCILLGLDIELVRNKIVLTEAAIIKYYENVMHLKAPPSEEEKSYYERRKGL